MTPRPDALPEPPPRGPAAPRRVAVLLRNHLGGSAKAAQLAGQLDGIPDWDLYLALDETGGPIDPGPYRKVPHSLEACRAIGLFTDRPRALHYFGDYPFYASLPAVPDYDFYLMVEYDVAPARPDGDYFRRLARRLAAPDLPAYDLVATELTTRRPERTHRPTRYPVPWHSLFPVIGLSRRALLHLYRARLAEGALPPLSDGQPHVYCEYFLPTTLCAEGAFLCGGLNDLLPGSVDRASFNAWNARVLHHEARQPVTAELVHPVLDLPQYLRKAPSVARKKGTVPAFLEELAFLRASGLDAAMIDEARAGLLARVARDGGPAGAAQGVGQGADREAA